MTQLTLTDEAVSRLRSVLENQQAPDGAFRHPFRYKHYQRWYEPGWVSGMAQGLALSVFARAYYLSCDHKLIVAGDKAFDFLARPPDHEGSRSAMEFNVPPLDTVLSV